MNIKLTATPAGTVRGMTRPQLLGLVTVGVLGLGGCGFLVYQVVHGPSAVAAPKMSTDEAKLEAKVEEKRAHAEADARRLRQQDLGQGYQFDAQGNLVGASAEPSGLQNRPLQDLSAPRRRAAGAAVTAAIASGIDRPVAVAAGDDEPDDGAEAEATPAPQVGERRPRAGSERGSQREPEKTSMLGYSTVVGAGWAVQKPERKEGGSKKQAGGDTAEDRQAETMDRLVSTMEQTSRSALQGASGVGRGPADASPAGYGVAGRGGPAASGDALMPALKPAESAPQPMVPGAVGDMRIGGAVGQDVVVMQGKFLDCAVVNEIRADLVESPVIAQVSRDFVSLDGKYVLVPAGSKLLGEAGKVQNLQQERVYLRFDRIVFPDQRSAYFPVRKVAAVDQGGAVGVNGDVDRHLFLQFGAAVMLGVLDGLGAAVQGNSAASNPTVRDLVMARTSADFSNVVSGVIQKYANVVPTITIEAGSKLKVFFSEDVRLSPYMKAADLTWVKEGG